MIDSNDAREASRSGVEIWSAIPSFEGIYEASNLGSVRSLDRLVTYSNGVVRSYAGRVLKQSYQTYFLVTLCDRDRQSSYPVHGLVLSSFDGIRQDDRPHCRHLDGNAKNNALYNLRWGTAKENLDDRKAHGTSISLKGENHLFAKLNDNAVREIRNRSALGVQGKDIALEFGVSRATVSEILQRKAWRHI